MYFILTQYKKLITNNWPEIVNPDINIRYGLEIAGLKILIFFMQTRKNFIIQFAMACFKNVWPLILKASDWFCLQIRRRPLSAVRYDDTVQLLSQMTSVAPVSNLSSSCSLWISFLTGAIIRVYLRATRMFFWSQELCRYHPTHIFIHFKSFIFVYKNIW